jgi:uroporphyrinogen decarboxylase
MAVAAAINAEPTTAPFLEAAARRATPVTPVWFMRQAGRYMPEYRAIRKTNTLLQICAQPDLAAEVTLQPVKALGVDAAILFADILLPLAPMGLSLEFVAGEGPQINNPIRNAAAVAALRVIDPETDLASTLETIRIVRRELPPSVPLIGFAGAPFTVATYSIEGGPSKHVIESKRMMYGAPEVWHALMERLSRTIGDFLIAQIRAGAQAVQLFDSWAGLLSEADYRTFAMPHTKSIFARLKAFDVPTIHFAVGADHLLGALTEAGGDVIGLDWRTPLDTGWRRVGHDRAIQGNLDPVTLLAPMPEIKRQVDDILARANGRAGHIFNLGHGILQNTPVDAVRAAVDYVHERSARAS